MPVQLQTSNQFQQHVEDCGKRLVAATKSTTEGHLQQKWLDLLINRTISDPLFRVQALRFIDVLPSLEDDQVLAEHLQEYFSDFDLPLLADWGLKHSDLPWAQRIAAPTIRYTLRGLARKFMGGSQLHHALTSISRLRHHKMNFTLDLLGEATISEMECDLYQKQYLHMINSLSEPVSNWHQNTLLDVSHGAQSPRLNLSIKLSSLYSQIRTTAPQASIDGINKKLRPILRAAVAQNAFLTIDMEQYDFKHIVLECFRQIVMEKEFIHCTHIGLAMQAYLKDTYEDLTGLIELAKSRGTPFTIRLVRGAYWDYETAIAKQNNWDCPVWQNKNDTDINFENCLHLLLSANPFVHTAVASHNPRSIAYAIALTEELNLAPGQFEFQMLYGMADSLKRALVKLNYRLRIYVPFGETLPGMAYLVRRLLENSSGQSILDSGMGTSNDSLADYSFAAPAPSKQSVKLQTVDSNVFSNTPVLRFTDKQQRLDFKTALGNLENNLGHLYPLIINGKEICSETTIDSFNPSNKDQLIGKVSSASRQHADMALDAALNSFHQWSNLPVQHRADYLRRVAALLTKKRMEFSALEILEAGKNWQEADADVCEAIDFLNFYANQAESLGKTKTVSVNGELNQFSYSARGASLILPPWNFPLAILCGMLSASLVTGNTCILKPSSLTPVTAAKFMQLWQEVNLPDGVLSFLPGSGKSIGDYLARKPDINIIAFTGSLEVGSQLLKIGTDIQPGQHHIKKVITEMGGKNAIIIDSDADLDEAVLGTIHSAFGFQGQKCSAASRVIVVKHIYSRFVDRLKEATKSLCAGAPAVPQFFTGPVIDDNARKKILSAIEHARLTATIHSYDNNKDNGNDGYFINPCIFTDVDPESPLAQEEIFGPVLAVIKCDNFHQAVAIANNTRFALTGGVYSRQPSHLQYARQNFQVGNLYLNRKTTGALVGRQPFGGFKMSGTGSKTGGEEYLTQFMYAYCVTENTLRRGFAPDPD